MRLVIFCVLEEDFVHVGAGVLEQFVGRVEDDERDLTVAQDAQFVRLLHQAELPLGEGHLRIIRSRSPEDNKVLEWVKVT